MEEEEKPQFTPHPLDDYFAPSNCFQPFPNTSTNFSQPTNLSNPNRPYNLQLQQTRNSACLDDFRTAPQNQVTRSVNRGLRTRKFMPQNATTEILLKTKCSRPSSKTKQLIKLIIKSPLQKKKDNPACCEFTLE